MYTTRKDLLETFDGDAAFVEELISAFLNRSEALLGEIASGLEAGDMERSSRAAHSLKGAIGYFESDEIYQTALAIELLTAGGNRETARQLLRKLRAGLEGLSRHLIAEVLHAA
jgi:HPt (histidine-containing phosphotransfer) domain-containing protein